uniref:Uncharacterized protein n=1 Tax=Ditylenchus dipsaci TaxID=166011 RepID=A0A915DJS7_9BILA
MLALSYRWCCVAAFLFGRIDAQTNKVVMDEDLAFVLLVVVPLLVLCCFCVCCCYYAMCFSSCFRQKQEPVVVLNSSV